MSIIITIQQNYGNDFGTFMQTYFNVTNQMLKIEEFNNSRPTHRGCPAE